MAPPLLLGGQGPNAEPSFAFGYWTGTQSQCGGDAWARRRNRGAQCPEIIRAAIAGRGRRVGIGRLVEEALGGIGGTGRSEGGEQVHDLDIGLEQVEDRPADVGAMMPSAGAWSVKSSG